MAVTSLADLDLVLRTPRLVLAPIVPADAADMWPYVSDPELPRFMVWEAHQDRAETEAFIARVTQERTEDRSMVWTLRENGEFRGCMGLHGITGMFVAWRVDRAELGYWLAPPFHGRGLATEAGAAVVDFAFRKLGLHKVTVGCITDNTGSRRVIEKLGFRFVGERRDHMFRHGRWWNHLDYELTTDEYPPGNVG
ncbi:MAG TPA: GNAT family N-acetyltransferase [Kofleriaceae bacterium]|nr:GNAT family N-acetyltransferase [Kofleriaceae bacterium]